MFKGEEGKGKGKVNGERRMWKERVKGKEENEILFSLGLARVKKEKKIKKNTFLLRHLNKDNEMHPPFIPLMLLKIDSRPKHKTFPTALHEED